jgi:hypothetical protein
VAKLWSAEECLQDLILELHDARHRFIRAAITQHSMFVVLLAEVSLA